MNFGTLLKDVMAIPTDFSAGNYQNQGKDIGNVIYIIVMEKHC